MLYKVEYRNAGQWRTATNPDWNKRLYDPSISTNLLVNISKCRATKICKYRIGKFGYNEYRVVPMEFFG